ncbi:MAG: hypothetical protein R2712_09345 [Vicinamibacterales bacterium]
MGFSTLLSAVALGEDEQRSDIAEENRAEDQLILRVQDELERRRKAVGKDYPFSDHQPWAGAAIRRPARYREASGLFCLFCRTRSTAHIRTEECLHRG